MAKPFHVLIIDDSDKDARLIARTLRKHWPKLAFERVDTAASLRTALEKQTWDCLLCNMVMPDFGASAALKILKQSDLLIPFIIISGLIEIIGTISLLKAGAQDFVRKDDLARLVPAIEAAMREIQNLQQRNEARNRLKLSEERFRGLFENSEISVWNEDLSEVKQALSKLNFETLEELHRHLQSNHQQAARTMASMVKVKHVNQATLKLFGAKTQTEFLSQIQTSFGPGTMEVFIAELCAIWEGRKNFRSEASYRSIDGREIQTIITLPIPTTMEGFQNVPVSIIDITELRETEENLRISNDKFYKTFQTSPACILISNLETGELVDVNQRFEADFGYSKQEIIGKTGIDIGLWRYPETRNQIKLQLQKNGFFHDPEFNFVKKSGAVAIVDFNVAVMCIDGEELIISNFIDITERKQAEEELRRYAQITASANDMQALFDRNFVYLSANKAYQRALNKSAHELIGQTIAEVMGKKIFNETIKPHAERCLAGEAVRYQEWFEVHNLGLRFTDVTHSPYLGPDNEVIGYVSTLRDITQFKQAETKLNNLTQRLQTGIDQMPIAYIVWDEKFLVTEWNPAAERMFGYTKIEMMGKIAVNYIVPEPARPLVKKVIKELLAGGESHYSEAGNNQHKDGTIISCQWYNTALIDVTGATTAVLSMAIDVTNQLQIESELRKLAQAVEQSPESIVITNLNAEIEYVNRAFINTTGYSREELIGKNLRLKQSGKTPPQTYKDLWDALTHGRAWKGELFNRRKNGSEYVEMAHIGTVEPGRRHHHPLRRGSGRHHRKETPR